MKGHIPYKEPEFIRAEGVKCIVPGSWYSVRKDRRTTLQAYRTWFDWDIRVWFCVADWPHRLCIPHRYVWTPNSRGRWRWLMAGHGLYLDLAIAANGLVVGGPQKDDPSPSMTLDSEDRTIRHHIEKLPSMKQVATYGFRLEETTP